MQIKTIKKSIYQKLEWWLNSITDKELRNDVRDNILLTGGSICNLLQQQDVNDYDIYLIDIDVLYRLCKYYLFGLPIEIMDGRDKDKYMLELDEREKYIMVDNEDDFAQRSVAIRNLKRDQVKLYIKNPSGYNPNKGRSKKHQEHKRYTISFVSPNAISLHGKIQIVTRFTGSPETIHKTFDFIHATNYFTFKEGLVFNQEALLSIMTKQLYYQGSYYPLSSIIRVKKFLNRGWKITAGEQLKMMYQCSKLNLDDPDILEEQLIGVDVAYFSTLVQLLREGTNASDSPESFSSERLMEAIDSVFNTFEYDNEEKEEEDEN